MPDAGKDRPAVRGRALALALVALALAPAPAWAHATLQATVPERGARLAKAPAQVEFRFDESVEANFGALRVFDTQGRQVQTGDAFHPGGSGSAVAVRLRPGLGDGTYTATYRVISADGHVVSSGFVFNVGDGAAPAKTVDALLSGQRTGSVTSTVFAAARALQYGAIALGLGALIFLLTCWLPGLRAVAGAGPAWQAASTAFARRLERLLLAAAIAGLASGVAVLVLQGAAGQGSSFWDAASVSVVREVLGTRFGTAWGCGVLAWAAVLIVLLASGAFPPGRRAAARPHEEPAPPEPAVPIVRTAADAPPAAARPAASGAAPTVHAAADDPPAAARPAASGAAPTVHAAADDPPAAARPAAPVPSGRLPTLRAATIGATGLARPGGGARLAALAVPLFALALLPALGGHASVQSPVALLAPANVLHVLAMSAWLGGIAVLVLALRAATAQLEPLDRTRLLAAVVGRFSTLAGLAVAVLLASGIAQAIVEVRTPAHLLDTAFGRAVLIKAIVAVGIVTLGWINRSRLLPALRAAAAGASPGRTGVLLRRTLRAELALGLVAIGVTGALSTYPPSIAVSSGPYSTSAIVGPARLEVTVDPARVGPNQLHLYLFDRRTGAPSEATEELTVTAALPGKGIAPIKLSPHVAGPGHFVVDGASLAVGGRWTIHVTDRVSEFDQYETRFSVPIR